MCKKVRDLIDLYVAGDLPPREAETVEEHLAHCEACRGEAASYRRCLDRLAALSSEKQPDRLSPFFWQGIQKEILTMQERGRPPSSRRVRRLVYGLAAAILISVTAYLAVWLFGGPYAAPAVPEKGPVIVREDGRVLLPPGSPIVPEKEGSGWGAKPSEEDSLRF